jgi:hypothetical protein
MDLAGDILNTPAIIFDPFFLSSRDVVHSDSNENDSFLILKEREHYMWATDMEVSRVKYPLERRKCH